MSFTNSVLKPVLFLFLFSAGCNNANKTKPSANKEETFTISKVKLTDLSGQPVDLSQFEGKVVFINFWATWCKPCIAEMPSLQRMTQKLKDENIIFLFASDETTEEIRQFKNSNNYPMIFVKTESLADMNIMGLPTTLIFDANGIFSFSELGARDWDKEESLALIKKIIQ